MTNNNATGMVEKKNFMLPDMVDGDFTKEELAEDYEGLQLSFPRVKIPAGGALQFELPSDNPEDPDYTKVIEGVILYSHSSGAYWPEGSEYDDNVSPLCATLDGKTGVGTPGGACAVCPLNQYGTATDGKGNPTKGKACKNMRQLYIYRSGDFMPIQLTLPPTSLTPYSDFVNACFVSRHRPLYAAVVQIGLKKVEAANTYSVATFKKVYDFVGEELAAIKTFALNFREQIKGINQMRMAEAMNRSESEPFYEDTSFNSTENGTHFEISSNDVLNGDTDTLPM